MREGTDSIKRSTKQDKILDCISVCGIAIMLIGLPIVILEQFFSYDFPFNAIGIPMMGGMMLFIPQKLKGVKL